MRFPNLPYWLGEKPFSHCSFCGRALLAGEEIWRCSGLSVCIDCFPAFAREQLAPFHTVLGEEEEP